MRTMPTAMLVVGALLGALSGCGSDAASEAGAKLAASADAGGDGGRDSTGGGAASTDARSPCDPLAEHGEPIALQTLLGIGSDAQGTVYVADQPEPIGQSGEARVFVSHGTDLTRVKVDGSGSAGGGAATVAEYTFSFTDGATSEALLIETTGGATTAMGLGPQGKAFLDQPDPARTRLTVRDASALAGLTVKNLPGGAYVRDVADGDNGNVLVVTVPTVDPTYETYRFFYGPPSQVVERVVTNPGSTKSGALSATLALDDGPATLNLTISYDPPDAGPLGHAGPGTLTRAGGARVVLTERLPVPATLPGLSFTCLGP